jgi:para-nitrobenzyl esterase
MLKNHRRATVMAMLACIAMALPVSVPAQKKITAKDRQAARAFSTYVANFAKRGDPIGGGLPAWLTFDPARFALMDFASVKGPVFRPEPRQVSALVERVAQVQSPSFQATGDLGGTTWQLVKFQGGDDTTLTPDDRSKYTIAFETDGNVSTRIDCNRGRGTWKSSGLTQLEFGPLALTRAMCLPGSLHDRIVKDWGFVRSYIIKDGHLFLSLMADGGIYEFEPIGGSPASAPQSSVAPPSGAIGQ